MRTDIYQILYCSRNCIQGTTAEMSTEIKGILEAARRNNSLAGVTGALLFNSVLFAQVLEGPLDQVEQIFEKIQCDRRHSDLTVLTAGQVGSRFFAEWSMAFAGAPSEQSDTLVAATLQAALANPSQAGEPVLSLLRKLVLQEEAWAPPDRQSRSISAA